jgi:hypothetical protein
MVRYNAHEMGANKQCTIVDAVEQFLKCGGGRGERGSETS